MGDKSGTITWDEFSKIVNDDQMKEYFMAVDIDVTEAEGLFHLLDINDSGHVGIEEFIMGCMRLKGTAKSIDLANMLYQQKRERLRFDAFSEDTKSGLKDIKHQLKVVTRVLASAKTSRDAAAAGATQEL